MPETTIYHNPRCTKSRQTLSLLREHEIEPKIIEYLKNPPSAAEIKRLLKKLGISANELIRKKEFKALGVPMTEDSETLIEYMSENPQIIERPIVVSGKQARIGRPPEQVLEIL